MEQKMSRSQDESTGPCWKGYKVGSQKPLPLACVPWEPRSPTPGQHTLLFSGGQLHLEPPHLSRPCSKGGDRGGVLQGCGRSLPPSLPSTGALLPEPPQEKCREPTAGESRHTAHGKGPMLATTFGVSHAALVPTLEGIGCPVPERHSRT